MKCLLQRVSYAKVYIENKLYSQIDKGLLVLVCFCVNDADKNIDLMVKKVINLRIFEDNNKKFNLSLKDIKGSIMLVSQFTLAADTKKGNRPSFFDAMEPAKAIELYNEMVEKFKNNGIATHTGVFGASMQIELLNDGPVTIMLET